MNSNSSAGNSASSSSGAAPPALLDGATHARQYLDDYYAYSCGSGSSDRPLSPSTTMTTSMSASAYASSTSSTSSTPSTKSAGKNSYSKNVNVYTTCGRHSNEWLFSGWSAPFRRSDQREQ